MARRSGNKTAAGWNPRLLGLVLCAFFVLGVMTGFSAAGRAFALRISDFIGSLAGRLPRTQAPSGSTSQWLNDRLRWLHEHFGIDLAGFRGLQGGARSAGGAIALVERHDGFYALFADGELRGPVSPNAADDLPVLSGPRVENARGSDLVEFAAMMVRAEAALSHLISEMKVDKDGTASLYLERAHTMVVFDLDSMPAEMARAAEILGHWRDREQMISAIDLTTPGEAVVSLAQTVAVSPAHGGVVSRISDRAPAGAGRVSARKTRSP